MKNLRIFALLVLLTCGASAMAEEAYFFVWSSCKNCCQSGEGEHLYVSKVIFTNDSDWDNLQGPFIKQVKAEYPNGAKGATTSAAYETEVEAGSARRKMISGMRPYAQIHDIDL